LSLDDEDDFNWSDFFRSQFADIVSTDAIERFKKEYQGGEEEKLAVIEAYVNGEGDMEAVFEQVMLSNPLDDEERFRKIIDDEIDEKRVEAYDKYVKETKASRKRRATNAKKEAAEALEMARELGVEKKLFGNGTSKKRKANDAEEEPDYSDLAALIQQRQKSRAGNFLADLEAKYASPKKGGKKSKRAAVEEPPEEAFQKTAERAKRNSVKATEETVRPRKSKRAKR
jgi:DnaJ family protein C protein 9